MYVCPVQGQTVCIYMYVRTYKEFYFWSMFKLCCTYIEKTCSYLQCVCIHLLCMYVHLYIGGTGFTPKNWRKRWMVLKEKKLYYYKTAFVSTSLAQYIL